MRRLSNVWVGNVRGLGKIRSRNLLGGWIQNVSLLAFIFFSIVNQVRRTDTDVILDHVCSFLKVNSIDDLWVVLSWDL